MASDYTVIRGTTYLFTANVTYPPLQPSSPPYKYTLLKNNVPQVGYTDISFIGNDVTASFTYIFNETSSTVPYVFGVYIKDNCGIGIQSNTDTSNITVIEPICPLPICDFLITQL